MMWTTRFAAALAATLALLAPAAAADFTLNVNTALTVDDALFNGLEAFRDDGASAQALASPWWSTAGGSART